MCVLVVPVTGRLGFSQKRDLSSETNYWMRMHGPGDSSVQISLINNALRYSPLGDGYYKWDLKTCITLLPI